MIERMGSKRYSNIDKFCKEVLDLLSINSSIDKLTQDKDGSSRADSIRYLPLINLYLNEFNNNNKFDLIIYNNIATIEKFFLEGFNGIGAFDGAVAVLHSCMPLIGKIDIIDEFINKVVLDVIDMIPGYMSNMEEHPNIKDCNMIEGLSSIGAVLLPYKNYCGIEKSIKEIVSYIVDFTKRKKYYGEHLIRPWYEEDNKNKKVIIDHSIGVGISGPLAFLSLALKDGIEVIGQKEEIEEILNYIINKEDTLDNDSILREELIEVRGYEDYSYLNGYAGIISAMYLASDVLDIDLYKKLVWEKIINLSKLNIGELNLKSPNFNNGTTGLLYLLIKIYKETVNKELLPIIFKLIDNTLEYYYNELTFIENINKYNSENINYLESVAIIALVLREAIVTSENKWDNIFLI